MFIVIPCHIINHIITYLCNVYSNILFLNFINSKLSFLRGERTDTRTP